MSIQLRECTPLSEWLPELEARQARVLVCETAARSLRSAFVDWSELGLEGAAPGPVVVLGQASAAEAHRAVDALAADEAVVELVPMGGGFVQALLLMSEPAERRASLAFGRATTWSALGVNDLQQWRGALRGDVLVTCGRKRG